MLRCNLYIQVLRCATEIGRIAQTKGTNDMGKVFSGLLPKTVVAASAAFAMHASTYAAKVEYLDFKSESMQKTVPVSVIVPDAYEKDDNARFSVVYALHGAGGESKDFYQARPGGLLSRLSDQYGFIAVCPDGAKTSWWIDSPVDPNMKYETLVAREILPFIDEKYRTISDKNHRAIFGVSMGGHGACYIGFRHHDLFGAVGNIVGGVDLTPYYGRWGLDAVLGKPGENTKNWQEFSVITQARNLKNGDVELVTFCGTSDFFLGPNRLLHDLLSANRVKHTYVELRGADEVHSTHTISFAHGVVPLVARFFDNYFRTGKASL